MNPNRPLQMQRHGQRRPSRVCAMAATKSKRELAQAANLCVARSGFHLRFGDYGQRGFQNV
jgi:hypothetical protein